MRHGNDNSTEQREALRRIIRMRAEQMRLPKDPELIVVTEELLRKLGVPEHLIEDMVIMAPWHDSLEHLLSEYGL